MAISHMDLLGASLAIAAKLDSDAPAPVIVSHSVVEGSGTMAGTDNSDDDEFSGNQNNERVAFRLTAEKERVKAAIASRDTPTSFHRAGDPANPSDISAGGLGGASGDAAAPGTSDVADKLAHMSAWGLTKAAVSVTKAATKTPPGGADLLGDDSKAPPAGEGPQSGNTEAGGNAWGQPPGQ